MKQSHAIAIHHLVGLALLLGLAAAAHAAPITQIDQQNQGSVAGTNGGGSFGQSFTPTLPAIDAIEFLMADFGQPIMVKLRDGLSGLDGLDGPIIATSNTVTLFTGLQTIHFDFLSRVALIPNHTYVAQLFTPNGIDGVSWTGNTYAGGQFLEQGIAPNDFPQGRDLIFTEGLTRPLPVPGSGWLFSLGLAGLALASRRNRPA